MNYTFPHRTRGFTIIELLVVIVIIGLLTTLATTSYINAQRSARDSARKAKVSTISVAVEAFYRDKQRFPGQTGADPGQLNDRNGCEFYDTNTGDFVYAYFPTEIGTSAGIYANCGNRSDIDNFNRADYRPYPNWIPGLGDYMNPAPTETRYLGPDGIEGAPLYNGTGFHDPLTRDEPKIQTLFYRKLKGGYAVYSKLELPGDKDATPLTTYTDDPKFNNGNEFRVVTPNLYIIRK